MIYRLTQRTEDVLIKNVALTFQSEYFSVIIVLHFDKNPFIISRLFLFFCCCHDTTYIGDGRLLITVSCLVDFVEVSPLFGRFKLKCSAMFSLINSCVSVPRQIPMDKELVANFIHSRNSQCCVRPCKTYTLYCHWTPCTRAAAFLR